jgi:outer membrane immunogenic protein
MRYKLGFSLLIQAALVFGNLPAAADGMRSAAKPEAAACCHTWSGAYIGFNVGWADGDFHNKNVTENDPINGIFDYASFGFSDSGMLLGLQSGYNWQRGDVVFGLESDIQGMGVSGSRTFTDAIFDFPSGLFDTRVHAELEHLSTFRGRVGLARDHWLIYATAGLAYGEISTKLSFPPAGGGTNSFNDNDSKWHFGYAVGAGAELKLSQVVSLKFEYLYVDLGDKTHTFDIDGDRYTWDQELDLHVVRAGLNFKLGDRSCCAAPLK